VADGSYPGPVLRRCKITRDLREMVEPFVHPAGPVVRRLVVSIPQIVEVAFQVIERE
jgi:hypothetical protein